MPIVIGLGDKFQLQDPMGLYSGDGGGISGTPAASSEAASSSTGNNVNVSDQGMNDVIDTIIGEAGGEGPQGMAAVASVIRNRALRSGQSPDAIVRAPKQFAGYSQPGPDALKARQDPQVRAEAEKIIQGVFSGQIPDTTDGADHFAASSITPSWASKMARTTQIGNQIFYREGHPTGMQAPDSGAGQEDQGQSDVADSSALAYLEPRIVGHGPSAVTGMKPVFRDRIAALFQAAPPAIQQGLGIYSGYRSPEHQAQLWQQALQKYGSVAEARKWVAPPPGVDGSIGSRHNMGLAADLSFDGKSLKHAPTAVVDWVHQNAERFGLHFPLANENWHIEPIGSRGGNAPTAIAADDGSNDGGVIVAGAGFKAQDPMGLMSGSDNPFASAATAAAQKEQAAQSTTSQTSSAPNPVDSLFQKLNTGPNKGRYQIIDESQYDDWRKQWQQNQPSQLMQGLKASLVDQNPTLLGNALDALGTLSGSDRFRKLGDTIRQYGEQGSWARQPKVGSVADIRTDSLGHLVSDASDYAAYAMGQGLGSMAPGMVTGVAASAVTENPVVGLVAGAYGPSYVQNLGDLYGMLRDDPAIQARVKKGEISEKQVAGWAAAAAVPMAALDSVSLGKILGHSSEAVKHSIVKRVVHGLAEGALTEGTTEGLQQVIEEGTADALGSKTPLKDQAISVLDNAVAGALSGGPADAVASVRGGHGEMVDHGGASDDIADGTETETQGSPAQTGAAPTFTVSQPPVGDLGAGPLDGQTVTLSPNQDGVSPNMRRVVKADGTEELVGEDLLKPNAAAAQRSKATPLRNAVDHGQQRAAARAANQAVPDGAPPVGSTVRVDADGVAPFMATVDSYQDGEAVLFESGTGEVMQVPTTALTKIADPVTGAPGETSDASEPLPEKSNDPALEPQEPQASETKTELPPRTEQTSAMKRLVGPPQAGQRVVVDNKDAGRFPASVESYEEGHTEAVVKSDNGQSFQVPVTDLYTSKLTDKQAEAQELKKNPPVEHEPQETDPETTRKVGNKTMVLPDRQHAELFDFGRERQQTRRLGGASTMQTDEAMQPEQERLADKFGVTPQALGQLADDYRYRVQRAAKESHTDLPINMATVNQKRLSQWQKERQKLEQEPSLGLSGDQPAAAAPQKTGAPPDLSAWWDGELTPSGRQQVLDAAGIKRSPKVLWKNFNRSIQSKLAAARDTLDEATATGPDAAAHEAATSPQNDLPEPTQGQKEAGNYKIGRLKLGGLDISIENPEGSERSGVDPNGQPWSVRMKSHYGYIRGTVGPDKDHIDTFVKPGTAELSEGSPVYVVDQKRGNGHFDEHKVMLGFHGEDEARKAYLANYAKGWRGLGKLTSTTLGEFKHWLEHGDTGKPFSQRQEQRTEPHRDFSPLEKRAVAVYERLLRDAEANPTEATKTPIWHETIAEQAARPGRYHPVVEEENPLGLKVGDPVKARGRDGYVVSIATHGPHQQARVVGTFGHGGWYNLDQLGDEPVTEPTSAERAHAAVDRERPAGRTKTPPKLGAKARIARDIVGAGEGGIIVPSQDVGYSSAGRRYRIQSIGRDGAVHVQSVDDGSGTSWSFGELLGARKRGNTFNAEAVPETESAKSTPEKQKKAKAHDHFADNKIFTADKVEAARARLKSKLSQLNSGVDPETLIDGMTIAGAYIEAGVRDFSAFAKRMSDDFGDAIKPYLLSFWEGVRHYPGLDTAGMTNAEDSAHAFAALNTEPGEGVSDQRNVDTIAAKETSDEPAELERPGEGALEGASAREVSGTEGGRQAERSAAVRRGSDLSRDERAGAERVPARRGVPDGEGAVSVPAGETADRDAAGRADLARDHEGRPGRSEVDADRQVDASLSAATPAAERPVEYRLSDSDELGDGGAKTKFRNNIAAIETLRRLEEENRPATRDEQSALAKWVGWGSLRNAFPREDGSVAKGWEKEAARLKTLLTPDEYRAAESSTRNAHYTSPEVVKAMWDIVRQLGYQGGQILEPSVGAGNFIGFMPGDFRDASRVTGVELDNITGGIAKNLYPNANIQAPKGFQDLDVPDGHFELAIGNPPFGSERLYDRNRKALNRFSIHNFFFAKSVDALKPNGVLAMVVTNHFMDSSKSAAREYIAKRADLLGAIRLPNNAFLKNAGTEVTTDIVVLRRRDAGEAASGPAWTNVGEYKDREGRIVPLNEYFVGRPDMMLGDFGAFGSMYRKDAPALVARNGEDLADHLGRAIRSLPQAVMTAPGHTLVETVTPAVDISDALVGSMFIGPDGTVMQRKPDVLGEHQAEAVTFPNEKAAERVGGMVRIRDAFARLRRAQIDESASDEKIENLRGRLNSLYDGFVRKHGPINADANRRLFRDDPTWPQISALEENFEKGISKTVAAGTGEAPRPASADKAPIFFKRTQQPYRRPTTASSAKDALATVLADRGHVDLDAMSRLYRKTPEQIVAELGPLLYKTPSGSYETADHYLSGNVKEKLAEAERAATADPDFRRNVAALRDAVPADIEPVDIDVKPGAPWIPSNHIADFISHIADSTGGTAFYSKANAKWAIEVPRVTDAAQTQWATDRAGVQAVLNAALNGQTLTISNRTSDGKQIVDTAATDAANEKVERVKTEWKRWIWDDDRRRPELAQLYNDTFNTDVVRKFDGSHLTFPGKVGDDIISLRPHQKNAVWRVLQSGTTLLDHTVGAGKTFAMVASIMEMRRTGQARKPMLTVPNHLVGQWAADFVKLYPGAKVLAASKKDFSAENRKRLFARVATGDWDAVIVPHSSFGRIAVDPAFEEAFIRKQIGDLEESMSELRTATGQKSRNVAQLSKWRDNMEAKLKRLLDAGSKDVGMTFDEMGIDALAVDEAHEFKNLGFATSMQRVAGLGNPQGSQKASDLYMKVQSVLGRTGGKNIIFATGTPLSNTMAEMYTVQRYLDGNALDNLGLAHFDAWARVFGEVVTDWELSPSGQYKLNSRFAKFVNMPELMQRYLSFADVITNDDIKAQLAAIGKTLPLPKVKGGKPTNIVVERTPDQADYVGEPITNENGHQTFPVGSLVYRAEHLPKRPGKGEDNMLKIMSDARKAALDMRLISPSYPDVPGSKVHIAADQMKRIYDAWNHKRGTQLVFIDLSTPKEARAREEARIRALLKKADDGDEAAREILDNMSPDEFMALDSDFSVYDDLKKKLVDRGIPADEIAFIHDANTELQKEELFGKVRSGRVRLLFGSTPKMGAGTNVQNRLVALHHLDAPWRPSDLEQRDGRGIRQGNELYAEDPSSFELEILRYATKNTLDARQWQTIEGKARFIQQLRKGGTSQREIEDIAGEVANAAEMKAAASGNPLILEEMDLRQKIRRMEGQSAEHDREQHRIRMRVAGMKDERDSVTAKIPDMEADAARAKQAEGNEFPATINGDSVEKPKELGSAIISAGRALLKTHGAESDLGTFAGFPLHLSYDHTKAFALDVVGKADHQVYIADIDEADPVGLARRVTNTIGALRSAPEHARERLSEIERQIPALEKQVGPWSQQATLDELIQRHRDVLAELQPKRPAIAADQTDSERPRASMPDDEPVATINGDEMGVEFHGPKDMPALRKSATTWYDAHLRGTTVMTRDGLPVEFNQRGRNKSTYRKGDVLLRAVPAIPEIIRKGTVVHTEDGNRADITERMVIAAPVRLGGQIVHLAVSIHKTKDGNYQYDFTPDRDAGDPGIGARLAGRKPTDSRESIASADFNLLQLRGPDNSVDSVARELGGGPLGPMVEHMLANGSLTIGPDVGEAPGAAGYTTSNGHIHLNADRLRPGFANSVLLHEAFHSGRDALFAGRTWSSLMNDLDRLYRQYGRSSGRPGDFFAAARERVQGLPDLPDSLRPEEFGAYTIENYENAPRTMRLWADKMLGYVKAWALRRFGRQIGKLTPAQLHALAIAALRDRAGRAASPAASLDQIVADRKGMPRASIADDHHDDNITENRIIQEIKGKLTDLQPAVLATVPLNYFPELARPNMTAVSDYLNVKRALDTYRGNRHADSDKIAGEWLKFSRLGVGKDGKAKAAQLADLMHEATLAGIDPSKTDEETIEKPGYDALRKKYMKLPPAGRRLFNIVRDAYKAQAAELDQILLDNVKKAQEIAQRRAEADYKRELERIDRSGLSGQARKLALDDAEKAYNAQRTKAQWTMKARLTKMRQAFEASRVEEPYFPLARFGRYFVTVRNTDGDVLSFSRREKAADRDRLATDLRKAYPGKKVEVGVMSNASELREAMDPRIVAEIETIVGGAGIDPSTMSSMLDQIWQRYLETMPDLSVRKRFIHRQGVAGFQTDALRAFSSHMFHAAHQMGRLKYGMELQELTNEASDQARKSDDPTRGMTLANELKLRHKWVMNPTGGSVAQTMTSTAFVYYLAGSPAAALVNMTQTPMLGIPILGARFGGIAKAAAAISKAAVDSVAGRGSLDRANLSAEEKRALAAFNESGLIDRTRSHDLAGVGETGVNYSPVKARVMAVLSYLFHRTEVWNREVTALASYRLARKAGQNEMDAINTAHDLTWKTHFDYSNASRPRIMQNDFAKVALVFRSYNINMLYRVARDTYQAFKADTPQARKEARYQLAGIYGMMGLLAGTQGVIGFNIAMAIAGALFGDDNDPLDFQTRFRKSMLDILGPQLGGVVLDGVPGHYLGIDLTGRVGMPDLWFRSPNKDLQGQDEYQYWLFQALGATVGIGADIWRGAGYLKDGNIERGLETIMPKYARDVLKAYRYANEGVTSIRGDQVLDRSAIDPWDIIAQAVGFTPAKVAETWDRNSALKNAEQRVLSERRTLINRFALAARMGDQDGRADAIAAIKRFNSVPLHRPLAITPGNLIESLRVRERNANKREDGVLISNRHLGKDLRLELPEPVYR